MDNTAQKQTDSASTSAATSKTSQMRSASLEAKGRGALVSLSAEDVLRVLDSNADLLEALEAAYYVLMDKQLDAECDIYKRTARQKARAAIAKATKS